MSTSSIFANFDLCDDKTSEAFVEALEASEHDVLNNQNMPDNSNISILTDFKDIYKAVFKGDKYVTNNSYK